jgi:hypothetical protein
MTERRRDQFTYWKNREAISDMRELLAFLKPTEEGNYRDRRYLRTTLASSEVEVAWYYEKYSDEDGRGYHYYEVDPGIAKRAVSERLVVPGGLDNHGVWRFADHKLALSEAGRKLLEEYIQEAKKLLAGGDSDAFAYRTCGRDGSNGEGGGLYFEFETPQRERVRVYPASRQVMMIDLAKRCA